MLSSKLDQLANFMIRPRRNYYQDTDLGPKLFKSKNQFCSHQDFQVEFQYILSSNHINANRSQDDIPRQKLLTNQNKYYTIKCSLFVPAHTNTNYQNISLKSTSEQRICVLAMHGNTGSRMSSLYLLQSILKYELAFAIFDFLGCGNSDGQHITLGYYQKYQIGAVLAELHYKFGYHRFILFGRSMGAASALLYCSQLYPQYITNKYNKIINHYEKYLSSQLPTSDQTITTDNQNNALMDVIKKLNHGYFGYEIIGLIMDSPYYDTKQMFMSIANNKLWFIPKFIINYAITNASQLVKQKLSYITNQPPKLSNPYHHHHHHLLSTTTPSKKKKKLFSILDDIKISKSCQLPFPVYMIYGFHDDIISIQHSCELFKRLICKHKKFYVIEDQGHGGHRNQQITTNALQWILGYEFQRVHQRLKRDAQLFTMNINQYITYLQKYQESLLKEKQKSTNIKQKQKQKQKCTSTITQLQNKILPKISQKYFGIGSLTTLDNPSLFSQSNAAEKIQLRQWKRAYSDPQNRSNFDIHFLSQLKLHQKNYIDNQQHSSLQQTIFCQTTSNEKAKKNQQKRQIFLAKMSRVNPFEQLRNKTRINNKNNQLKLKKKRSIKKGKIDQ